MLNISPTKKSTLEQKSDFNDTFNSILCTKINKACLILFQVAITAESQRPLSEGFTSDRGNLFTFPSVHGIQAMGAGTQNCALRDNSLSK
jgi:hypothetical protein